MHIFSPVHTINALCQGTFLGAKRLGAGKPEAFEPTQAPESAKNYAQTFCETLIATRDVSTKCLAALAEGTGQTIFPLILLSLASFAESVDPAGMNAESLRKMAASMLNDSLSENFTQFIKDKESVTTVCKHLQMRHRAEGGALIVLASGDSVLNGTAIKQDVAKIKASDGSEKAFSDRPWTIDHNEEKWISLAFEAANSEDLPEKIQLACKGAEPWAPTPPIDSEEIGISGEGIKIFGCCPPAALPATPAPTPTDLPEPSISAGASEAFLPLASSDVDANLSTPPADESTSSQIVSSESTPYEETSNASLNGTPPPFTRLGRSHVTIHWGWGPAAFAGLVAFASLTCYLCVKRVCARAAETPSRAKPDDVEDATISETQKLKKP